MLELTRLTHTSALSSLANLAIESSIEMILIKNNTITDIQLIANNSTTTINLQKEINNTQWEQQDWRFLQVSSFQLSGTTTLGLHASIAFSYGKLK